MEKKLTMRIPRRRSRLRQYGIYIVIIGVVFAVFYSVLTGSFHTGPEKQGRVETLDGGVEILRGDKTTALPMGDESDFFFGDSLLLSGGSAKIQLSRGDILKVNGKGMLNLRDCAGVGVEIRLSQVSLDGFFEKPDSSVTTQFVTVFPKEASSLLIESDEDRERVCIRTRLGGCTIALPYGGNIHMDGGAAQDDSGYQEVVLSRDPHLKTLEVRVEVHNRGRGVSVGTKGWKETVELHHLASAVLGTDGNLSVKEAGERFPVTVALPNKSPARTPPDPPSSPPPAPKTPPKPDPRSGPVVEAAPKPVPSPPTEEPVSTDPRPTADPKPVDPVPSSPKNPPADAEDKTGKIPSPPQPGRAVKPVKSDPKQTHPAKPAGPVKPRKTAVEKKGARAPGRLKPAKVSTKPSPRPDVHAKPPKPERTDIASPRPTAPPPVVLRENEIIAYGRQLEKFTLLRNGQVTRVQAGKVRVRSGDVVKVRAGCVARLNIGNNVIVTLREHTRYRVP